MDKPRVLCIDDEDGILFSYVLALRRDFEVHTLNNGKDALQFILKNKPHAIVSDICMPQMRGDEMYEKLVKQKPEQAKKIIFVTGSSDGPIRKFLKDKLWLEKPINLQTLIKIIEKIINGSPL